MERSAAFFTDVYGLFVEAESAGSVYLRAWNDHDPTTLKLTAAPAAGLGHVEWRCTSTQALTRRVSALEQAGVAGEWIDRDVGHGNNP